MTKQIEDKSSTGTNDAAERLRASKFLSGFQKRDLDAALDAERRATVERIRWAGLAKWDERGGHLTMAQFLAILHAEAER